MKKTLKTIILIFIIFLFILVTAFIVNYFVGYKIYRDVRYGDKAENAMDIYIPDKAYKRECNGCIVVIHGGSWSGGDKSDETARCRLLASQGYIVASINYTLWSEQISDEYDVFLVLDEIESALLEIQRFAGAMGINVNQVALTGYSAGAHLAMLYSYSRSETSPLEIAFTASMAGPADITPEVWGVDMTKVIAERLTGEEITEQMIASGEADELLSSISPISYIGESAPPTLIIHGGKDPLVSPKNADSLIYKLSQNGVEYDYIFLKDSDHSLMQNPIGHLMYYKSLIEYCQKYFES